MGSRCTLGAEPLRQDFVHTGLSCVRVGVFHVLVTYAPLIPIRKGVIPVKVRRMDDNPAINTNCGTSRRASYQQLECFNSTRFLSEAKRSRSNMSVKTTCG